jgi:cell envelope-related function transcriptional attenuator common domain
MSLLGKIAIGLCVFLLLIVFAAIAVVYAKMNKLDFVPLDPDKLSINDGYEYDETGYLNVALFGLDTRENDEEMGSRSDTIIIASLNRETKEVKMSSVYRDTYLQMDDRSYNKANAAYSFGEEEEAVAMLNRNLDMDIDHYITVDFSALVDVIDALDGIDVEVTEEEIPYLNNYSVEIIKNTGVDTWAVTEPGYQHLTGVQATAYARIRYTEGDDFRRTERQRLVIEKIAEKAQAASLGTLNNIIDRVLPKVRTNFTLPEILAYAKDVKKYQIGESKGFPFNLETMVLNVGDSVIPANLEENVKELHNFLFGENGFTPSKKVCDISDEITFLTGVVGNGSYDSGDVTNSYGGQDSGYSGDNGYGDGTGNGDGSVSSGDPGSNGYEDGSYNYGNGNYGSEDYGTGDGIYDPGYEDSGTGDYGTVGGDGTNTSGDYQDTYY